MRCSAGAARIGAVLLTLASITSPAIAQGDASGSDLLRGGAFQIGPTIGLGVFGPKSELASCTWFGARVGHRFAPLAGNPRVQLGFRSGWEGCLTEHSEVGRVDLIHINAAFQFGLRVSPTVLAYWDTGLGMLLGDSTVGGDEQVLARFAGHAGPGVTWALGRHFLVDLSARGLIFENFNFGDSAEKGTTFAFVPVALIALQI